MTNPKSECQCQCHNTHCLVNHIGNPCPNDYKTCKSCCQPSQEKECICPFGKGGIHLLGCAQSFGNKNHSKEQAKCECNKYLKISNYVSHCPLHFPSQYDVETRGAVCGTEQAIVEDQKYGRLHISYHELRSLQHKAFTEGMEVMRSTMHNEFESFLQAAKEEGYKQGCEEQRKKMID